MKTNTLSLFPSHGNAFENARANGQHPPVSHRSATNIFEVARLNNMGKVSFNNAPLPSYPTRIWIPIIHDQKGSSKAELVPPPPNFLPYSHTNGLSHPLSAPSSIQLSVLLVYDSPLQAIMLMSISPQPFAKQHLIQRLQLPSSQSSTSFLWMISPTRNILESFPVQSSLFKELHLRHNVSRKTQKGTLDKG